MPRIRSYIPEALFLDRKDESHMRICREDFVLVDPSDSYRVVVGRGKEICEGEPFAPLRKLPKSERDFMARGLADHTRLLLQGKNGPILVFGELLAVSGLLLVLCPRFDIMSVHRGLLLMQKHEFASSSGFEASVPTPHRGDAAVYEYLQEIFYYLDRILLPSEDTSLWTSVSLIANFAGCRADFRAMPAETVAMSPFERLRLSAFLLCLFLSMRKEAVAVSAKGELSDAAVSVCASPIVPQEKTTACRYSFLQLPRFRDISLRTTDSGWVMEASFCRCTEKPALHSLSPIPLAWCVFFNVQAEME